MLLYYLFAEKFALLHTYSKNITVSSIFPHNTKWLGAVSKSSAVNWKRVRICGRLCCRHHYSRCGCNHNEAMVPTEAYNNLTVLHKIKFSNYLWGQFQFHFHYIAMLDLDFWTAPTHFAVLNVSAGHCLDMSLYINLIFEIIPPTHYCTYSFVSSSQQIQTWVLDKCSQVLRSIP